MSITTNLKKILSEIPKTAQLVAVSKFHTSDNILEAYQAGQRIFGESRAQELIAKNHDLSNLKDIQWHFIGHLQTNKIKQVVPIASLIQSADSLKVLKNINKEAKKRDKIMPCLLQLHIADEKSKYGFTFQECKSLLENNVLADLKNIKIYGVMGMATNTKNTQQVKDEFKALKAFFNELKNNYFQDKAYFKEISMGMSQDYPLALEEGSTLIRVGSKIFGERNY